MNLHRSIFNYAMLCLCFGIAQVHGQTTKADSTLLSKATLPKPIITYETYLVDSLGWGYKIKMDGKYVINQPFIPSVEGIQRFQTENDAKKMAIQVAKKIDGGVFPPNIKRKEVDSLQIVTIKK